ncbi:MAG: hypothetical protein QF816_01980 [Candidatus Scalindua sp.]|nr:hypothetical protein [Candidatus Scalindua sp.]
MKKFGSSKVLVVRYKQAFRSFLWKGLQNRQEEIDACIERKYSINSYRRRREYTL